MRTKKLPPVRVDEPLYAALKKAAKEQSGGNLSELIRTVLRAIFLPPPLETIKQNLGPGPGQETTE